MWREFLRALWSDWLARISGLGSLVLTFIPILFPVQPLPGWAYWVTAAIAFLFSSYRVWLNEHQALLVEKAKNEPALILEFKHHGGSFLERGYYKSGNPYDLYRVRVTNSGVSTVKNVRAVIEAIEPKNIDRLPLDLQVMDKHSRNLAPDGEIYFEVVYFDPDQYPHRIRLCKSDGFWSPVTLPAQQYSLTIKVTGDNVRSVTKSFSIHTTASRLFMSEHVGPPSLPPQNSSV